MQKPARKQGRYAISRADTTFQHREYIALPDGRACARMKKYRVGILGATGTVGQRFVQLLEGHPQFEITDACCVGPVGRKALCRGVRVEVVGRNSGIGTRDRGPADRAAAGLRHHLFKSSFESRTRSGRSVCTSRLSRDQQLVLLSDG